MGNSLRTGVSYLFQSTQRRPKRIGSPLEAATVREQARSPSARHSPSFELVPENDAFHPSIRRVCNSFCFASASAAPQITCADMVRHAAQRSRRHAAPLPYFASDSLFFAPRTCGLADSCA
eukprot:1458169-Pleurochrysis_carterae.AAC.1